MTSRANAFRIAFIAVFALMTAVHPVLAQGIRGRVVSAETKTPLAGAIVQARTADGSVAASTLTSARGAFTIEGLADATYTLRILRIGFRPFDSPPVVVANGASDPVQVDWTGEAIALAAQVITSERTCKVSADSGTMIARVWNETRKALLTSVLSEDGDAPIFSRFNYTRRVGIKDSLVVDQQTTLRTERTYRAFEGWAPESLAANGYASEGRVGGRTATMYRAPDASALMAESFAATHCFSLVKGTGIHDQDVGLAFEPSNRPNSRVDIRGTFWIDRATSLLRRIDFGYVGLPSYTRNANAGGYVQFAKLTSGQWILSSWHIRMARFHSRNDFETELGQESVDETGGLVLNIAQDDTTLFSQSLPVLTLHLAGAEYLKELAGSKIQLVGTDLVATTNAQGRVIFRNLIPGRYAFRAIFPSLAMFGSQWRDRQIVMDTLSKTDSIIAPDARALLRASCGSHADRDGVVALFGTVRDTTGLPNTAADGVVTAHPQPGRMAQSEGTSGILQDRNGQFLLCAKRAHGEVLVRAENTQGAGQRTINVSNNALMQEVPLGVVPLTAADSAARSGLAIIEFRVMDSEGLPVPRIRITAVDVNGQKSNVVTDMTGRAILVNVPLGLASISAGPGAIAAPVLTSGRNLISILLPEPG